jgi:hypothetical protein
MNRYLATTPAKDAEKYLPYWKTKRLSSPELVGFVRRQQIRRLFWMESQWR